MPIIMKYSMEEYTLGPHLHAKRSRLEKVSGYRSPLELKIW